MVYCDVTRRGHRARATPVRADVALSSQLELLTFETRAMSLSLSFSLLVFEFMNVHDLFEITRALWRWCFTGREEEGERERDGWN